MRRLHFWLRAHPELFDKLAVAAALPFALLGTLVLANGGRYYAGLLSLAFCVPLWFRSRRLVPALYLTAALGLLALLISPGPLLSGLFAGMVMAYSAAAYAPRPHSWAALALATGGGLASGLRWGRLAQEAAGFPLGTTRQEGLIITGGTVVICTAPLVISWLWGGVVNARQAHLQEVTDRAARAEREREALARVAVVEERARIAREMHDIVAHSLSVIILQADGAAHIMDTAPERARQALDNVSRTGREALADMRRLLGVLRTTAPDRPALANPPEGRLNPQPGLHRLEHLIEQVRVAGLAVQVTVDGDPGTVPAGIGLSTFRIVQEALTNTLKHGGPRARAWVRLEVLPDQLRVRVSDDGRGAAAHSDGAGHGLLGMRERAAAVGGRVSAGPRPGGGFEVLAQLPYQGANGAPVPTRPAGPATATAPTRPTAPTTATAPDRPTAPTTAEPAPPTAIPTTAGPTGPTAREHQ